jgi:hypothetical protein
MQPLQNNVDYSKEKMQPLGEAQTQTEEQPAPERSFTDRVIDGGLDLGIDALSGAENVLGNAFIGGMADAGIKGTQFVASKMPFLSKIPGAARVAPYLMRDPRLAAAAATGTAAYQGTKYLMDKTGAAEGIANMIVGNKDYSKTQDQQSEEMRLLEQGYNPYKPLYNENRRGPQYTNRSASNIIGYERTPGFDAHIAAGGTEESYANRNDNMPQDQGGPTPQGGYANPNGFDLGSMAKGNPMMAPGAQNPVPNEMQQPVDIDAYKPNLQAVQAAKEASQPNLGMVQPAPQAQPPAEVPGIPQYGDLVGSYKDKDGRNVGIFEGMPMRNEQGELTYIGDDQVAAMQDKMDAQGAPVISGKKEGNLVPFIDNMGNVQYGDKQTANGMNAIEAEYQREDKEAHQKFLQSDAAKEMTARSLQNARADVAAQNEASRAREARMNARPDFNAPRRGATDSADGLTAAQRRRMYPNPADAERSKRGILPDGTSMEAARKAAELKQKETQARIDALKEKDPSKYEANVEVVNGLMDGPQFENLDDAQKARVKTIMMMELMGIGTDETQFEFDGIVYPSDNKDKDKNVDAESSTSE